jgi:subtilisin
MATSKRSGTTSGKGGRIDPHTPSGIGAIGMASPETTGRYLVLLRRDAVDIGINALSDIAGIKNIARTTDFEEGAMSGADMTGAEAIVFDKLAVAVVDAQPDQIQQLGVAAAADQSGILAVEEERVVYALQEFRLREVARPMPPVITPPTAPPSPIGLSPEALLPVEYLRGYRDAVDRLVDKLLTPAGMPGEFEGAVVTAALDESEATWGLQVTKVINSRFSGKGIRIAVLDTGLDLQHQDFVGRRINSRSFMTDETAVDGQDGHGHGTHCIGTACGSLRPTRLPRYGIAYEAEIFAGKVLSDAGRGADSGILAGIDWAITSGCQIISMSLGSPVGPFTPVSRIFEEIARRALEQNVLIIAAASNDSRRPFVLRPVGHPANCRSIMAVAAIDASMNPAWFSNAGFNKEGGQVDIAGPGMGVYSSWIGPEFYNTINGTSMATPHVAGIAALHAEANPGIRGRALMSLLIQSARRLEAPARDVGAGLVQAP